MTMPILCAGSYITVDRSALHPKLAAQLTADGVDLDRMLSFLEDLNAGRYDSADLPAAAGVPSLDHPSIFDRRSGIGLRISRVHAVRKLAGFAFPLSLLDDCEADGDDVIITPEKLETIGIRLYGKTAFGVLNGGSASSYADHKKNSALNSAAWKRYQSVFSDMELLCHGKPKGITPSFIHPDGSPGWSFLEMKLRAVALERLRYERVTGLPAAGALPFFQMTSVMTDAAISAALQDYASSPLLNFPGAAPVMVRSAMQRMMAAVSHSSEGAPRRIFDRAYGNEHCGIAMPGGHGQNFEVLGPLYRSLREEGYKYVWLGNIDNMGYTPDPVSLAVLAIKGADAAFEESVRTEMDVKGGILVCDNRGRLTAGDIGPMVSTEQMLAYEAEGNTVLFNCGIGLFDLDVLVPRLDRIPFELPLRITDQDKDAGRYAQAEQITWEVIGLLDNPLFFAVEKSSRFLAAKMLMETIMTSIPAEPEMGAFAAVSRTLHTGLNTLMSTAYGLELRGDRWFPAEKK